MRVCRRVGNPVMRPEIGFHFDDPAGKDSLVGAVNEQFAQEARSNALRGSFEERAGDQSAWKLRTRCIHITPLQPRESALVASSDLLQLPALPCVLFHSLMIASTSSAWPSGLTSGKICSSVRSGPIKNVVRAIPITFLPYMFFSFITPN